MNNFNEISTDENSFSEDFENFLSNRNLTTNEVSRVVAGIISQVREHGDKALTAYTKEFDGFETEDFLVTNKEKDFALNHVDSNLIESLEYSFEKILSYQTKCFESLNLISLLFDDYFHSSVLAVYAILLQLLIHFCV